MAKQFTLLSCFYYAVFFVVAAVSASHSAGHQHLHKKAHPQVCAAAPVAIRTSNSTTGNGTVGDPQELIQQALAALAVVNKARIENPYFNIYEFSNQSSASDGSSIAPPLDLGLGSLQNSTLKKARDTASNSSTENTLRKSYSISPELAAAARNLAESTTQVPTGDQPEIAASIRKKVCFKGQ
ncbi:MAG: hypothetical protein CL912_30795 [Deltaproteobacteria bacterium]|nr:hypothetical protein [Deltaproteobacteria bacterium]